MQRLILFRFHDHLDVCRSRLELLRHFNPGVPIHGLYGGPLGSGVSAHQALAPLLDTTWEIPVEDPAWKWQHGDLALVDWYWAVGQALDFEVLHLLEWDLLVLAPLDRIYGASGHRGVALTGLTPLHQVERRWYWTTQEPHRSRWHALKAWAQQRFGYAGPHWACQGPANVFSRAFLEGFAGLEVPELGHEELRLPLVGALLGLEVEGLPHIHRAIHAPEDRPFFNCDRQGIHPSAIDACLSQPEGRRVFHPCAYPFSLHRASANPEAFQVRACGPVGVIPVPTLVSRWNQASGEAILRARVHRV